MVLKAPTLLHNVVSLGNDVEYIITGEVGGAGLTGVQSAIIIPGEPFASFFGYTLEGYDADGQEILSSTGGPLDDGRLLLGSPHPDFTFGMTNQINFGNMDFSFYIWSVQGNEILNNTRLEYQRPSNPFNNINLFAYHLPLDAHSEVGNNVELGRILGVRNMKSVDDSLLWQGELDTDLKTFSRLIEKELGRVPEIFGRMNNSVHSIAWCTGGAQGFIDEAINLNVDVFLSGEVSERTPAVAKENDLTYISAGHHATERYGVQSLCRHLSSKFNLKHNFLEVGNSV